MSDSNRVRVSLCSESTYGTTPTSPTMHVVEVVGQSLRDAVGYQASQTIRNSANVKDLVRLSKAAGGGLPTEAIYPNLTVSTGAWLLLAAALRQASETAAVSISSCSIASGAATVTRASGSFVSDGIEVGDIVQVSWASGASSRWGKATAVAALTLTLQLGDGYTWPSTVSGTVTVDRGRRLVNGTAEPSFSVEIAALDVDKYAVFTGMVVDGLSIRIADQQITRFDYSFQGKSSNRSGSAISGATYAAGVPLPVLDALGMPAFYLGGTEHACKSFGVDVNLNVAPRTQVGDLGPQSARRGQFVATGRMEAYFAEFTEMTNYADGTASDLWFVLRDSNSSAMAVSLPRMKWSDISAPDRGVNQDRMTEGAFQAFEDPVEGCTMKVFLHDASH